MTRLLLVAAALVVVLAAAGVGAGAEWDVYPGDSIQDALAGMPFIPSVGCVGE